MMLVVVMRKHEISWLTWFCASCAPVKQKTSKPDFFICGQEEKLNNILCSCLCCIGQLRYLQNRNWNISTESWLHHSMYLNCPSVWKGGNEFLRVCLYPPDFPEQSLGYLFLYLYLYFCQYLHPYLWAARGLRLLRTGLEMRWWREGYCKATKAAYDHD